MTSFEEYVLNKVITKNIEHYDILLEAASQVTLPTSTYIIKQNYNLNKRRVSDLYKKMFDLTDKPSNLSVNHYLYKQFNPGNITEKKCNQCKITMSINHFYSNGYTPKGSKKYKAKCKKCFDTFTKKSKKYMLNLVDKKLECEICLYSKCEQALEFHHFDPSIKEYILSSMSHMSDEKIKDELEKGFLLCANCHREVHYGLHDKKYLKISQ